MRCLACRAVLPESAKFCIDCGAPAPAVCGACARPNPPRAKFCLECGARLGGRVAEPEPAPKYLSAAPAAPERPAAQAERRQLTVLFCDLVGSTELSSRLDPEDLREVIGAYYRCVADTIARFDGFVARYMGDGALAYFGFPSAHEDNAERAVRAALALVTGVGELAVLGQPLRTRIGIATGMVIVGEIVRAGAAAEQTALGETPNLAARLQALAEPDTVVIADTTRRLVGNAFEFRDLGAVALKGFEVSPRAWRVLGRKRAERRIEAPAAKVQHAPHPEGTANLGPTPLVGREQELALLRDRWSQVLEGQGRVALLCGDGGVGKSRLVQAMVGEVGETQHTTIEFRGSAYHTNSPLYPVSHVLPGVLGWGRDEPDAQKRAKLEAFCARYRVSTEEGLPLLAALLSLPVAERFPLPPMSPERQKQRTLQTLLGAVLTLAADEPVLLVVEDLQWIDPTTMELIALIVGRIPSVRLFALFTARRDFKPDWPAHSHVTQLVLMRFSERQSERMVEHVAGGRPLPPEVVSEIVAKTDGVPLFIEELTKMVLESGLVEAEGDRYRLTGALPALAIPATLQDSLTARLDRLATVKTVAQLCATLGREFSYAMLRAVAPLDEGALQHELARLVDAELLYQRGVGPDVSYVFKHVLLQEAAYQSLLRSTRQQYHARIAQVMVERFVDEAEARPEFVARHFTEAGLPEAAARWWQRAGQHAFRRASCAEAIAHYHKGLGVLGSLPRSDERDQLELGFEVELGYALIPVRGWAAPETAQAFTRAGALSRQIGDAPKLFRALWGLGAFHFVRGDQRQARQVADQCLAVAQHGDDADALIEARYLRGIVACAMGEFAAGCADLEECIRLYGNEVRDAHRVQYGQDARASALGWLAMALWARGEPDAALERAEEGLAFVRGAVQPFLLARGLAGVGFVRLFRGEPQGPDSPLQAALDLCVEQGFGYFHAVVSAFHGAGLAAQGSAEEGIALIESNVAALRVVGAELLFTLILGHLAAARLARGNVDAGLAAIDEGLDCAARTGERWGEAELHRIRGHLLLSRNAGEGGEAERCFVKALDVARAQQAKTYELRAARSLAQWWQGQGRGGEARTLLSRALAAWPETLDTPDLRDARVSLQDCG
jgi:class 3 adenylate cyclase/predicted ATPase